MELLWVLELTRFAESRKINRRNIVRKNKRRLITASAIQPNWGFVSLPYTKLIRVKVPTFGRMQKCEEGIFRDRCKLYGTQIWIYAIRASSGWIPKEFSIFCANKAVSEFPAFQLFIVTSDFSERKNPNVPSNWRCLQFVLLTHGRKNICSIYQNHFSLRLLQ